MIQTSIHLQVYGYTWQGFRSCYQYNVTEPPKDIAEAKRRAGDFESLIDFRVVKETTEFESLGRGVSRRIDTFKTLRGWRNGMSNQRFDRIVNG